MTTARASLRRGFALVTVAAPFLAVAPLLVSSACGAGVPLQAPSAAHSAIVRDASASLDGTPHETTLPATCARDAPSTAPPTPLDAAEVDRLEHAANAPDATSGDRARAELALGALYFQGGRTDAALAILGPLVWSATPEIAMPAAEMYVPGMLGAGASCRVQLMDEMPRLRRRLCSSNSDDRCRRWFLVDFDLREGHALEIADTAPADAAAAFEALLGDMCRPAVDAKACADVAYDAGTLWIRAGDLTKARRILITMKDSRNGMAQSPLVRKLECALGANRCSEDGGR